MARKPCATCAKTRRVIKRGVKKLIVKITRKERP